MSRDDRRPVVDPRGAAAVDALIAAIADADADRRSFGELDVGAAAQPARAHGDLGTVCPLVTRADLDRPADPCRDRSDPARITRPPAALAAAAGRRGEGGGRAVGRRPMPDSTGPESGGAHF